MLFFGSVFQTSDEEKCSSGNLPRPAGNFPDQVRPESQLTNILNESPRLRLSVTGRHIHGNGLVFKSTPNLGTSC